MHLDNPLTDREFDELDRFLLSDRCSDNCMTMDALHGFLTAVLIGPETVPMQEWLPRIWGPEPEDAPAFRSPKEMEHITGLLARFCNEIAITFEVAPKEFEPLFSQFEAEGQQFIDGEPWAWGFWEGMQLRADQWEGAPAEELGALLRPIVLLGAEELEEEELPLVDTPAKVHRLSLEVEAALPEIRRYWAARRKPAQPIERDAQKTGRNDLCPCGSGKKFKKCCGAH
ncbi:MAG: YecA family protein [Paucimonas sp.]|nr:YecA family protein [Paucimonas sp.]